MSNPAGTADGNSASATSILIVDDDELNLKVLARRLEQEGFIVVVAASVPAAMDMMDRQRFNIALLDVDMPGMNGIELLRRIQKNSRWENTQVIMLSGINDPSVIKACLSLGAADYLIKPFVMSLARSRIERCLRRADGASSAAGAGAVNGNARILIVDDDDLNRRLLVRQLGERGFSATSVENGKHALQYLAENPVDLVLLDINMPRMSGTDILRRIRSNPATERLPVIMVTGNDDTDSWVVCIESGADGYITKPVDIPLLIDNIVSTLRARAMDDVVDIDLG